MVFSAVQLFMQKTTTAIFSCLCSCYSERHISAWLRLKGNLSPSDLKMILKSVTCSQNQFSETQDSLQFSRSFFAIVRIKWILLHNIGCVYFPAFVELLLLRHFAIILYILKFFVNKIAIVCFLLSILMWIMKNKAQRMYGNCVLVISIK